MPRRGSRRFDWCGRNDAAHQIRGRGRCDRKTLVSPLQRGRSVHVVDPETFEFEIAAHPFGEPQRAYRLFAGDLQVRALALAPSWTSIRDACRAQEMTEWVRALQSACSCGQAASMRRLERSMSRVSTASSGAGT
jgi:hypothetical protein